MTLHFQHCRLCAKVDTREYILAWQNTDCLCQHCICNTTEELTFETNTHRLRKIAVNLQFENLRKDRNEQAVTFTSTKQISTKWQINKKSYRYSWQCIIYWGCGGLMKGKTEHILKSFWCWTVSNQRDFCWPRASLSAFCHFVLFILGLVTSSDTPSVLSLCACCSEFPGL